MAERYDTKSIVKLKASYVSNHTEESWYNETVYLRTAVAKINTLKFP